MQSFVKIKSSQNGEITLSTTDIGQSYPSHEIFRLQVCLLTLFVKIKFSRKFPDLQYTVYWMASFSFVRSPFTDSFRV